MSTRRIIIGFLVCFSIVVFVGQTQSQTSNSDQTIKPPYAERLRYMTREERKKAFEEWAAQRRRLNKERVAKQRMEFEQRAKDRHDGRNERRNQFLKQILEVTEQQWKVIEPKINKIYFLRNQSSISMGFGGAGGSYSGTSGSGGGYIKQAVVAAAVDTGQAVAVAAAAADTGQAAAAVDMSCEVVVAAAVGAVHNSGVDRLGGLPTAS